MKEIIQEFQHANRKVVVSIDEDPPHPRKDWTPLGTIIHWHRKYDFGEFIERDVDSTIESLMKQWLLDNKNVEVVSILPLYLFDHSGISLSTKPFGCVWDSGQVGWIYLSKDEAEESFEYLSQDFESILNQEIESYDDYLNDRCYQYEVFSQDGSVLESSGGYLGNCYTCIEDAKFAAWASDDPCVSEIAEEMSLRATFAMM